MEAEGAAINFQSVAERGSVSPGFLYGRPELRQQIEAARARQMGRRAIARARQARMDAGLQVLLAAKDRRIKELEAEVRDLTRQLALSAEGSCMTACNRSILIELAQSL